MSSGAKTYARIVDLSAFESEYLFAQPDAVRAFLLEHPTITPMLAEAKTHLDPIFGSDTHVVLDVMRDPNETSREVLYAFIQTHIDADRAIESLDEFNDTWWRHTLGSEAIPLHFALEYV